MGDPANMTDTSPLEGLRGKALWRELQREKVSCPSCQKLLSRRALRWKHQCPRVNIEAARQVLDLKALSGFQSRVETGGRAKRKREGEAGEGVQEPSMPEARREDPDDGPP